METALKTQPTDGRIIKRSKTHRIPGQCDRRLTGKTEEEIKDMRHANNITQPIKW